MTVLWGVMTLLMFAVVQAALFFYAGQVAATAAQEGVRAGRTTPAAPAAAARAQTEGFLARTAGPTLDATSIDASVDATAATVQVRVTATVSTLVPGVALTVVRDAVGALEQVR